MSEPKTVRVIEISDTDAHAAIELFTRAANASVGGNTFGENDAVDAIAKALATARAEGAEERWIPVGERMPTRKDGKVVLVWDADDREPGLASVDALSPADMPELTHWMPLPSEPASGPFENFAGQECGLFGEDVSQDPEPARRCAKCLASELPAIDSTGEKETNG